MHPFRDLPLRRKLTLVIMLTSTTALLVSTIALMSYEIVRLRGTMARDVSAEAAIIADNSTAALSFRDARAAQETLASLRNIPEIVFACIYGSDGRVFAQYVRSGARNIAAPLVPSFETAKFEGNYLHVLRRIELGNEVIGSVYLRADLREETARIRAFGVIVSAVTIASWLVALVLSTRLQQLVSEPILALSRMARQIGAHQDYTLRATKHGDDEIGALTDQFNQMLEQIQKRDEDLHASEERFRQVTESIREVFWMSDVTKNEMLYISPGYQEIWGRSSESAYASPQSWLDAIHPDDRERVQQAALTKQVTGEYDEEYRIVRSDGDIRWIRDRAFPVPDTDGRVYRIAGIADDITERKQAEAELTTLAQAVESTSELICITDLQDRFTFVNRAFLEAYGYADQEVLGQTPEILFSPNNPPMLTGEILKQTHSGGWRGEVLNCRKDGTEFPISLSTSQIRDESDHVIGLMGVARDITERRRLEKEVLEISDRERARLGQDLHDDLCQQLVSIAFASNLVTQKLRKKSIPEASASDEIALLLDSAITRARTLARGLYPVTLETEGLAVALRDLTATVGSRFQIECRLDCLEPVTVDDLTTATHLYRIAQEAITNAVRHARASSIVLRLESVNGEVTLRVADDGIGMSGPKNVRRGMGLQTMYCRATLMQGNLQIERGKMGGTEIICRIRLGQT